MENSFVLKFKKIILFLYILLLPIDAALPKLGFLGSPLTLLSLFLLACAALEMVSGKNNDIRGGADTPARRAVILYYLYFLLSVTASLRGEFSLYYVLSFLLQGLMTIGLLYSDIDFFDVKYLTKALYGSFLLILVTTLLSYDIFSGERLFLNLGSEMDPNYFSTTLLIFTFLFMYKILVEKKAALIHIAFMALNFLLIIFSGSRGGLIANMSVVLAFAIYMIFKRKHVLSVGIIFLVFIAFYFIMIHIIPDALLERFNILSVIHSGGTGRTAIWKDGLHIFSTFGLVKALFGTGLGTLSFLSNYGKVAHNNWLQSMIEGGIFGLFVFALLFLGVLSEIRRRRHPFKIFLLVGLLFATISIDVHQSRFFWFVILILVNPDVFTADCGDKPPADITTPIVGPGGENRGVSL